MELSFVTRQLGESTVLQVIGEVDMATAPQLRARLVDLVNRGGRSVIVDLTSVDLIDSTGLGVLIGARRRLTNAGGTLVLVVPGGPLREVFVATDLDRVFTIAESVVAAHGA